MTIWTTHRTCLGRSGVGYDAEGCASSPIDLPPGHEEEAGPCSARAPDARLIVSGPDLVKEICDDARFDKLRRRRAREPAARAPRTRAVHLRDQRPAVAAGAQHLDGAVQPAGDAGLHAEDARHRRPADRQVGAAQPGRGVDVPADMTRLTLDTIALCGFGYRFNSFYRDTPHPFVAGHGPHARASRRRAARQLPIQTRLRIRAQRQLEEDQAFMNDLVDRLIAERRAQGDAADNTDLLGRMLHRRRQADRRRAARRQHPRPVHHLPDRRPRDHQRAAVLRDLLPAEEPRRAGAGPRRGGRGARRRPPRRRSSRCTG